MDKANKVWERQIAAFELLPVNGSGSGYGSSSGLEWQSQSKCQLAVWLWMPTHAQAVPMKIGEYIMLLEPPVSRLQLLDNEAQRTQVVGAALTGARRAQLSIIPPQTAQPAPHVATAATLQSESRTGKSRAGAAPRTSVTRSTHARRQRTACGAALESASASRSTRR